MSSSEAAESQARSELEASRWRKSPFLALWTLSVLAATAAFLLHLGLRVRSMELGYELGDKHAHVARLREVKRVLELEIASHETPERVELVARLLLGMSEPSPDRIFAAGKLPSIAAESATEGALRADTDAGATLEGNESDEDAP